MADAADLKSVVRKDVRVRLPPSAPYLFFCFTSFVVEMISTLSEDGA
jgi:hypothetical protein